MPAGFKMKTSSQRSMPTLSFLEGLICNLKFISHLLRFGFKSRFFLQKVTISGTKITTIFFARKWLIFTQDCFQSTTLKNTKHSSITGATNWRKSPEVPTISQKRSSLDVNVTGNSRIQRQIIIPDIRTEQVTISIHTDLDT